MAQMQRTYRLMIVDDESYIREGLSHIVDWADLGFELAAVLPDGKDAISYLEKHAVDVILTDIRMPHVSGLELAKHVWETQPKTKVLLLTGYKDFEYARAAFAYGVSNYLLKPTELSELYETFRKLKEQMDREREEQANFHQLMQTILEQFFADLYFGAFSDGDSVDRQMKRLDLPAGLAQAVFTVVHLHIDNYEQMNKHGYGKEQIYKAMHHLLEMKYPRLSFVVPYQEEAAVTYIAYGDEGLPQNAGETVPGELYDIMGLLVSVALEGPYDGIYEMEKVRRKSATPEGFIDLKQLIEKQKLLFSYLLSNQAERAIDLLTAMLQSLSAVDEEAVHSFMLNLFGLLSKRIADLGIFCEDGLFELPDVGTGQAEMEQKCIDNLSKIASIVGQHTSGTENLAISRAKDFINENYDRDILLEDVANQVFLSPAYLSRIFKKYVGENFSDYLFKVRMNRAKVLLKNSSLKVYEVSEKVGIQTPKYFFKLFKDYTGLTPTEYRATVTAGGDEEL